MRRSDSSSVGSGRRHDAPKVPDRENARDRFLHRRHQPDRRLHEGPAAPERRSGQERRVTERRRERSDEYSREEETRIRSLVAIQRNRDMLLEGTRLSCPRCEGQLKLKAPTNWKDTEPVWEIRCTDCHRHVTYRQQ